MKRRADGRFSKTKTIDGRKVQFYSSAETERAALKDIELQMLEFTRTRFSRKHNFKMLADAALDSQSRSISHNTIETYSYSLKHLKPFFDLNIEDISAAMLQDLLNEMSAQKYSFSAISKTKTTFGLVLNHAIVKEGLSLDNFMRSVKLPKNIKKNKIKAPGDETVNLILNNQEDPFGLWALCLLCTGLRRGELAALQRKDVDLDSGKISVTKSVEFISNQPHLKETPKTESSIGTVPILDPLRKPLTELCETLQPEEFLFGKEKPLTLTQIRKRWDKFCKKIGVDIRGHQLRHAYAKLLYRAGIDPKTAQRLLRHADFSTTMNIYTDFAEELTNRSVDRLNEFLSVEF